MTIDRKRLRDLALAHLRCRSAFMRSEKMAPDDCLLSDEFASLDVAEIAVGLLDALDAAEQPAPDDARRWNALVELWHASTELTLTQDEDGGWSITVTEAVETVPVTGRWTGDNPDAAIDAAIQAQERTP